MDARNYAQKQNAQRPARASGILRAGLALGRSRYHIGPDDRLTEVRKFGFHNYHNTAADLLARQAINVVMRNPHIGSDA